MEDEQSAKRRRASQSSRSPTSIDVSDGLDVKKFPKASKACLNCRRQKMRCEIDDDQPPCRRCRNSNAQCLFKVRANGVDSADWFISDFGATDSPALKAFQASVLNRLAIIESRLGIQPAASQMVPMPTVELETSNSQKDVAYDASSELRTVEAPPDLWVARDCLVAQSTDKNHIGWSAEVIETLWLAFAEFMPPLHFSTHDILKDTPTPIMLAAVLHAAAMQHSLSRYAELAPFYQAATARAIAVLVIPSESLNESQSHRQNLHNALGIIITLLFSEAWIPSTGLWIAMVYQIILTGATKSTPEDVAQWRGLYQGLRVIDIEHASLRMMRPILPLAAPLPSLELVSDNPGLTFEGAYAHLTTIMHVGLSHFCTRHFPTIMQTVLGDKNNAVSPSSFWHYTQEDSRVIKGWAGELDNWLLKYHRPSRGHQQRGPSEANILLLQYQLQKLFVLSIYHPARGTDMYKPPANTERSELLKSARAALQLQRMGLGVWSNWDLVIISWAAHIVIDCLNDGAGMNDDRGLVQGHINALRSTHQPAPNLRLSLAACLEKCMKAPTPATDLTAGSLDYLTLFNPDIEAHVTNSLSQALSGAPREAFRPGAVAATLAPPLPFDGIQWTDNNEVFDSVWSGDPDASDPSLWPSGFQRVLGLIGTQKEA